MTEKKLLALYGGTFSPPHKGHIAAAKAFFEAVCPDRLLIIPSYLPPHKAPVHGASDEARLAMCRLAFSVLPRTEVSTMEIDRKGKSYTVDTLRALSSPDVRLVILVGTDMFLTLDTWHEAAALFTLAEIVLVRREREGGVSVLLSQKKSEYEAKYGASVAFLDADAIEISSTELRAMLKNGENTDQYLTSEVREYIKACHLYQD